MGEPPKKAKNAYMFFANDKREEVKQANPDLKMKEVLSKLGEMWREMSAEEKKPYEDKAAEDKERYNKEKEEYGDIPAKPRKKSKKTKKSKSKKEKQSSSGTQSEESSE